MENLFSSNSRTFSPAKEPAIRFLPDTAKDTELACKAIKSICPDMSDFAVCDCSRIGRYSEERTRPLVVKFTRSCDVAKVLANRQNTEI